jgi:superoxide dismutase
MTTTLSRRRFLGSAGVAATSLLVAGDSSVGAPPKESGLSSEGLLVGHAGFQPRTTMPLPYEQLPSVVCDVGADAFSKDYRHREDYVARFLDHVDWDEVSRRYRAVDRM